MQSLLLRTSRRLLLIPGRTGTPLVSTFSIHPRHIHATVARHAPKKNPPDCPVCTLPLPSPVPACNKCWNIFSLPGETSHHELFDLPYEPNPFIVNIPMLKKRFRDAQSICHPDSWASKPVSVALHQHEPIVNSPGCSASKGWHRLSRLV